MKHIINTAFILALTACYPVHADLLPEEAHQYLKNEDIIWKDLSGLKRIERGFKVSEMGYILYNVEAIYITNDRIMGGLVLCHLLLDLDLKTMNRRCFDENLPKKD